MRSLWILPVIALGTIIARISFAETLTVEPNGGADYTDIQSAIDAAADGDTVLVKPGEYVITEPIDFNRLHDPDDPASPPVKNIVVKSEDGAEATTIRMSETPANPGRASVVVFERGETESSILDGFKITGGQDGGVFSTGGSSPTVRSCTISGNASGGVSCDNSSPALSDCSISGNHEGIGGVFCVQASPTVTNCTISGNSVSVGGVCCWMDSSPTLIGCTISGNTGTGVSCSAALVTMTDCIVWGNSIGCLTIEWSPQPEVSFCCLETDGVWPGDGNINSDPLFCGFSGPRDVYVDETGTPPGDGSLERPFVELAAGMDYALSLRSDSPCIGTGKDGQSMGADLGRCNPGPLGGSERVLHVASGRYSVEGLTLAHGASIIGHGADYTVLEGTVCGLRTGAKLARVTVTGGRAGGIQVQGGQKPDIEDCVITKNDGSGVLCWSSSPNLTNCAISGNLASSCGGVYCSGDSSPTLTNCTISGNSGLVGCGGVCAGTSSTLTNCIVWGNSGGALGGQPEVSFCCLETEAVWPGDGNINSDPLFCGFSGPRDLYVDESGTPPGDGSLERPFVELAAGMDYALSLRSNSPCIGTGKDGQSMGADLGRCDPGPLSGSERVLHVASGRYSVEGLTLAHGASIIGHGADYTVLEGSVWGLRTGAKLARVTVTGGQLAGVRIHEGEGPAVEDCTISGNSATGGFGGGIACFDRSSPTIARCTISGNSAREGGGGVSCMNASPTLTNCRISGNAAPAGGGLYCMQGSSPTLTNCTISENWAYAGGTNHGGGVYCGDTSAPSLTNCIVWANAPESVCGSLGHCLTDRDPLFARPGEWVECPSRDVPPCIAYQWDPDTGEATAGRRWVPGDYRLEAASPAIDAGTSQGAPTTDIEGTPRPCGTGVDIGAYEYGACPASFQRGDADADGSVNITDGIYSLSFLFLGGPAPPCADAADVDDGGGINLTDAIYLLNYLFLGGPAPADPFDACGVDPTRDALDCAAFAPCGRGG